MKSSFILLTLVSAIFCSTNIHADTFKKRTSAKNCSSVDLRGPKLGPVRNQDTVGWCFGYTAADLVSYRIGKKVSALDVSMNFYDRMPEMPRNGKLSASGGGSDMGAVTYSSGSSRGYCLEEDLPSDDDVFPAECGATAGFQIVNFIQGIENYKVGTSVGSCSIDVVPKVFKNLSADAIQQIVATKDKSAFEIMNMLREENCKGKRISSSGISMKGGLLSGFESLKDIDAQLKKNNPVSYNYNANFLMVEKVNGVANHYSSIVGRRFDEGSQSCQYLIRNSWGRSCEIYPAPYDKQCEEGNIWVNEETVGENLLGVHFLN